MDFGVTFLSIYCYTDFGVTFLSTVTLRHYYSGDNVSTITLQAFIFFPYSCIIFLRFSVKARSHPYLHPLLPHRKPHPYIFLFIASVTLLSHSRTWLPNSKFQSAFVKCQLCTRTCTAQGHTPEQYEGCGLHRTTCLGNSKDMDCTGLHTRTL